MEEVEKLLGRKLTPLEGAIWKTMKDKIGYHFEKDKLGNLTSVKNE